MIIKLMLNTLGVILTIIINIVNSIMPTNNLNNSLGDIITTILSVTQQALNFMYLIFGETLGLVVPVALILIGIKFTIAPIAQLARAFWINTSN